MYFNMSKNEQKNQKIGVLCILNKICEHIFTKIGLMAEFPTKNQRNKIRIDQITPFLKQIRSNYRTHFFVRYFKKGYRYF